MTTKVTVEPAGHRVEVITIDILMNGETAETRTTLNPGEPPHVTHIHSSRSVAVSELPDEAAQTAAS